MVFYGKKVKIEVLFLIPKNKGKSEKTRKPGFSGFFDKNSIFLKNHGFHGINHSKPILKMEKAWILHHNDSEMKKMSKNRKNERKKEEMK